MRSKLLSPSALVLALASGAFAQTATTAPSTATPGVVTTPDANAATPTVTPPPGVADPMTTNSTTGTVDQEDHCQAPGTQTNTNPSAETPALPQPEQVCR